jgi:hypothetical protein
MSEKIYAWLLWLYPRDFRQAHGEDALQLFRDRARHEKGFWLKLRLWLDLLNDLAVSLPSEYGRVASAQPVVAAPCFRLLRDESPRGGTLLLGAVISLITLSALPFLVSHSGGYGNSSGLALEPLRVADAPPPESAPYKRAAQPELVDRKQVIDDIVATLNKYYIDPNVGQKMADALLAHENAGDYRMVRDTSAFADVLTAHLQEVSHDFHLRVEAMPMPAGPMPKPSPEVLTRFREFMQSSNCTFETVKILPHNIGYLKVNAFPPLSYCRDTAQASMAKLNDASAIIFDVRYNGGGSPGTVAFLASYLFEQPMHLEDIYNRSENSTHASWTPAPAPGNKLANKPAFVLVSRGTVSGAEEFAYDLRVMKRATIVGETTAGAAHMSRPFRIGDFFTIYVPVAKPINPITKSNWEGTGVTPDVEASPEEAVGIAENMARRALATGRGVKPGTAGR